ncbi:nucleoside triphosphate pyrophosphohydrolase [bacterium]|nr:nucleoside triphosphate pyrophosphohydrolase [bacterium]
MTADRSPSTRAFTRTDDPLADVVRLMARLRHGERGCPWDVEQTFETIAPYTIEEAYEVADAIERGDLNDLKAELGDLLFQVVFHSRMAEEAGAFTLSDVADALVAKMVDRHPHVFDDAPNRTAEEQPLAWEQQKAMERARKAASAGDDSSALDGVALALPALLRAEKLQKRAARVGFDWPDVSQTIEKLNEEIEELMEAHAAATSDPGAVFEEVGDLLFVATNVARKLNIDPEAALRAGNAKFVRRFRRMESMAQASGRAFSSLTLDEQEALWSAVKAEERANLTGRG